MKIYLFLILFSFSISGCKAQISKTVKDKTPMDLSFITNQNLKYLIVLMSCDTCAPISNIGYRVVVKLKKKEQKSIKRIKPKTWMELLKNSSTDYSANLILYSIYKKDAFILFQNGSEKLWKKYLKKEDLNYWNNILENKIE